MTLINQSKETRKWNEFGRGVISDVDQFLSLLCLSLRCG